MAGQVQRVDFTYFRTNVKHIDSQVQRLKGDQLVWWQGPTRLNAKKRSIPLTKVYFRQLFNDEPGPHTSAVVPLSSVGHYRIGTIWRDGQCISNTYLETQKFDVDFSDTEWSFTSRGDLHKANNAHVFHDSEYALKYSQDRSQLLSFRLPDNKNLLIPCTEYFMRAYARNMEACRAIATLRWSDVRSVFFDEPLRDEHRWLVKPSHKMRNYDATFLAHLLYDDYAESRIRDVNNLFTSSKPSDHIFIKAAPWFQGKGQLLCRGKWLNSGNTFLCLDLVGSSQPQGPEIEWQRKKPDTSQGEYSGRIVLPKPIRTAEAEAFLAEHSYAEPDHHSETVIAKLPPFSTLGAKRKIKKTKDVAKANRGRLGPRPPEATSYSSGDGSGASKNIGKLEHAADAELETQGFFIDIWNAFRSIMAANPDRVTQVNWYSPPKFREQGRPTAVRLRPLDAGEKDRRAHSWVYLNRLTGECRSLMVLRIRVDTQNYFCFEIQPDLNDDSSITKPGYSGVLMKSHVTTPEEFEEFAQKVCSQVRFVYGRFKNMQSSFPVGAKIFKHHQKDAKVLYRSRLINVFKDLGVKLV